MVNVSLLSYSERLQTFEGCWDEHKTTARQLAAIGHVCDRPPLESLVRGSRCVTCANFVSEEVSVRTLEATSTSRSYAEDFENFGFHHPSCIRLQVRIPLEPQALFPGLYSYQLNSIRSKFERKSVEPHFPTTTQRLSQSSSLFSLPTEIRLEIYKMILPSLDEVTDIVPLNRESARVITRIGYEKTGPRDTTKPNILRTCRSVNEEAMDLLYSNTTFKFVSTKIMFLFLRSIGKEGRELIKAIDIVCGHREDAISFALLGSCEKLRTMTIRLPRQVLLFSRAPIWCIDGMSCLLALSGLQDVTFGACGSHFKYMTDDTPDAAIVRRELTRQKGAIGDSQSINSYLNI